MIKIVTSAQTKEMDAYTIQHEPISGELLMERAATQCTKWLLKNYPDSYSFIVFVGPGNNGGDGLVIARQLLERNKEVKVFILDDKNSSELHLVNVKKLESLNAVSIAVIKSSKDFPTIQSESIIIDALYGVGLSRPLNGVAVELINYLNHSKEIKISIDIPSGLFAENNFSNNKNEIFKADTTLTFETPFLSFLFSENEEFVGKWELLNIGMHPEAIKNIHSQYFLLNEKDIVIKKRGTFNHKGTFGHGLMIAGSYGMMGAAVLSSKACMRSGIGLLTTHVPKEGNNIIQTAVPEVIASIDSENTIFSALPELNKFNAIAVGCGIGTNKLTQEAVKKLIENCNVPLLIDADALNSISENIEWLKLLPVNTIITPHPKEFDRIFGVFNSGYERLQMQIKAAKEHSIIIVLKGAHTSIALPNGTVFFNNTGNPGMATGGSGDVLTGMMLSFLAQGYEPEKAAINAVYLHGLAGDFAAENISQESLLASDIIDYISDALVHIKNLQQ